MRQQRMLKATARTRASKTAKSLGGGGMTEVVHPRQRQQPLSKWSAAARELASHRMRVADLLSQEAESDNEAMVASQVPLVQDIKDEAAVVVGVYPVGVGDVLTDAGKGRDLSDSEDEEVERLLLKYAAESAVWQSTDDEDEDDADDRA